MSFIPPSYNINKNLSNYFDTHINGFNLNTEPFYNGFDFCNKNIGLFGFNDLTSSYTSINPFIFNQFGAYPSLDTFAFTSIPNFANRVSYTPWNNNYSPRIDITNMFNAPSWDNINAKYNTFSSSNCFNAKSVKNNSTLLSDKSTEKRLVNPRANSMAFSNNSTDKTSFNTRTSSTLITSGNKIADGTNLTINGIDYSIFGSEASKIKRLRPQMQLNMEKLFKYANNKGWKISITSGFRSTEKQRQLYNTPGVYAAKPGSSRHEYGCAVDLKVNGSSRNKETKELGRYALNLDMRWGGTWAGSKNEPWHFDINPKTTQTGTEYVAVNSSNSKQFSA